MVVIFYNLNLQKNSISRVHRESIQNFAESLIKIYTIKITISIF